MRFHALENMLRWSWRCLHRSRGSRADRQARESTWRGPKAPKRVKRAGQRLAAFTILEVLIAATVLSLGIAGSLSGYSTVNSVYRDQRHMTQALQITEGVLEELLTMSLGDAWMQDGTHPEEPWLYDEVGHRVTENGRYRVQWEVTPNVPINGIRKISVRVAWDDETERDFSMSIHR